MSTRNDDATPIAPAPALPTATAPNETEPLPTPPMLWLLLPLALLAVLAFLSR